MLVTLFNTMVLREKQDRIAEAVLCCEEALRTRREVVPDARDDPNSLHLLATLVGYMPRSGATIVAFFRVRELRHAFVVTL